MNNQYEQAYDNLIEMLKANSEVRVEVQLLDDEPSILINNTAFNYNEKTRVTFENINSNKSTVYVYVIKDANDGSVVCGNIPDYSKESLRVIRDYIAKNDQYVYYRDDEDLIISALNHAFTNVLGE